MVHIAPAKLAEINPFLHSAYEQARQLVFTSGVCGKHFPESVLCVFCWWGPADWLSHG